MSKVRQLSLFDSIDTGSKQPLFIQAPEPEPMYSNISMFYERLKATKDGEKFDIPALIAYLTANGVTLDQSEWAGETTKVWRTENAPLGSYFMHGGWYEWEKAKGEWQKDYKARIASLLTEIEISFHLISSGRVHETCVVVFVELVKGNFKSYIGPS